MSLRFDARHFLYTITFVGNFFHVTTMSVQPCPFHSDSQVWINNPPGRVERVLMSLPENARWE